MNRNRYLLCLLMIGFMLYYAIPQISILKSGSEGLFSLSWLLFAIFAIAGNLTALLHTPRKGMKKGNKNMFETKKRARSY
ncbi:hypothetical protein ACE38V_13000 [Cytobacillus sp. Hz8]|uniref:hypothetical protein n=1 Tax=Cytobacillus sp. Hz8 TaxID=3347168 RepID=UPI0035D6B1FE